MKQKTDWPVAVILLVLVAAVMVAAVNLAAALGLVVWSLVALGFWRSSLKSRRLLTGLFAGLAMVTAVLGILSTANTARHPVVHNPTNQAQPLK